MSTLAEPTDNTAPAKIKMWRTPRTQRTGSSADPTQPPLTAFSVGLAASVGRSGGRFRTQNWGKPTFWKNQSDEVNQIATMVVNVSPPNSGRAHPGRLRIRSVSIFATKAP